MTVMTSIIFAAMSTFAEGQYVEVDMPGTEYHKCIGIFRLQKEEYTALSNVSCPNGSSFDYIVGINVKNLKNLSNRR